MCNKINAATILQALAELLQHALNFIAQLNCDNGCKNRTSTKIHSDNTM